MGLILSSVAALVESQIQINGKTSKNTLNSYLLTRQLSTLFILCQKHCLELNVNVFVSQYVAQAVLLLR